MENKVTVIATGRVDPLTTANDDGQSSATRVKPPKKRTSQMATTKKKPASKAKRAGTKRKIRVGVQEEIGHSPHPVDVVVAAKVDPNHSPAAETVVAAATTNPAVQAQINETMHKVIEQAKITEHIPESAKKVMDHQVQHGPVRPQLLGADGLPLNCSMPQIIAEQDGTLQCNQAAEELLARQLRCSSFWQTVQHVARLDPLIRAMRYVAYQSPLVCQSAAPMMGLGGLVIGSSVGMTLGTAAGYTLASAGMFGYATLGSIVGTTIAFTAITASGPFTYFVGHGAAWSMATALAIKLQARKIVDDMLQFFRDFYNMCYYALFGPNAECAGIDKKDTTAALAAAAV